MKHTTGNAVCLPQNREHWFHFRAVVTKEVQYFSRYISFNLYFTATLAPYKNSSVDEHTKQIMK